MTNIIATMTNHTVTTIMMRPISATPFTSRAGLVSPAALYNEVSLLLS